jgi:hypothetical protein
MRWFGFSPHKEDDGLLSFVRSPLAPEARFPRFHASVCSKDGGLQVNIHLDQEDESRQGNHQFVWAYHNPLVMEEGRRLEILFDRAREQLFKKTKVTVHPSQSKNKSIKIGSKTQRFLSFLSRQKILCRFF